ncbi:MAG TPA: hypothetical protein VHC43_12995 [Mycobacteriales bacterium]|nr:hypothetical protein [Mycobacteriales bacterium]
MSELAQPHAAGAPRRVVIASRAIRIPWIVLTAVLILGDVFFPDPGAQGRGDALLAAGVLWMGAHPAFWRLALRPFVVPTGTGVWAASIGGPTYLDLAALRFVDSREIWGRGGVTTYLYLRDAGGRKLTLSGRASAPYLDAVRSAVARGVAHCGPRASVALGLAPPAPLHIRIRQCAATTAWSCLTLVVPAFALIGINALIRAL